MSVKQLSVFAENKNGALYEITSVLAENDIDLRALSIADTSSYGVLRIIVSDPRSAAFALSSAGKIVEVTEVVGIMIPDEKGGLCKLLGILTDHQISVEYLYAFVANKAGAAYVVLRVSDNDATEKLLSEKGFKILSGEEITAGI